MFSSRVNHNFPCLESRGYVGKSCRGSRDFSLIFRSVGSLTLRFIQPKLSSFREDEQEKFTNRTEFAAKVTHVQDEFGMAKGFVDIPILYCLIHVVSGIWITTISRHLSPHASSWWHPLKIRKKKKSKAGPLSPSGISKGSEACGSSRDPFFQRIQQNSEWDVFSLERMISSISWFE